jgi:glycosyltransferase involved in cell wall biosynthesis
MPSSIFLSILIPVYNWDLKRLLRTLSRQCLRLPEDVGVEIIVLDDGSCEKYANDSVAAQFDLVNYEESKVNRGRSATRNALLKKARGKYILFLDADMLPDQDNFIQRYIEYGRNDCEIVCGGISYLQNKHEGSEYSFYLYKSRRTESLPADFRNTIPWRYLFTSNIMVRRDIVESVSFDSSFTGYGFEDIEWGVRLGASYTLFHIDNTCSHMGVMSKEQVFVRMCDSIQNYGYLISQHPKKIGQTGAAGIARVIKHFPDVLLRLGDQLLRYLFFSLSWNSLLFYIFQLNKAVLLAREMKNIESSHFSL